MRRVAREHFLPEHLRDLAYRDAPLPIGRGQTISQPYVMAIMAEALQLPPRARVLEVGTGSGYAAAVLAEIAHEVYTIERHAELAEQARGALRRAGYPDVEVRQGDGTLGWPERAPFHGIVVAAGTAQVQVEPHRLTAVGTLTDDGQPANGRTPGTGWHRSCIGTRRPRRFQCPTCRPLHPICPTTPCWRSPLPCTPSSSDAG